MTTTILVDLLRIAGLLHLALFFAGASMPRAVALRTHLATLPPFLRHLFLVYFVFIGMMLLGFGSLTFLFANAIAAGEPVARALCIMMLVFWIVRLFVAVFVFDVRPYLTNWFYRFGHQTINCIFVYLVAIYAIALWRGGAL